MASSLAVSVIKIPKVTQFAYDDYKVIDGTARCKYCVSEKVVIRRWTGHHKYLTMCAELLAKIEDDDGEPEGCLDFWYNSHKHLRNFTSPLLQSWYSLVCSVC